MEELLGDTTCDKHFIAVTKIPRTFDVFFVFTRVQPRLFPEFYTGGVSMFLFTLSTLAVIYLDYTLILYYWHHYSDIIHDPNTSNISPVAITKNEALAGSTVFQIYSPTSISEFLRCDQSYYFL